MIDTYSLTAELYECVRIDPSAGGAWVNAGAFDFETVTQQLIDSSPYQPSPDIREIRGRRLRDAIGEITDVDAVLEAQSTLVLVSCKKVDFSQDFDRGEYQRTVNNQTTVTDGLATWEKRLARIRASLRGRNYDFSAYDAIVGIVITPSAVFLKNTDPLTPTHELPSGFRPHMSFSEFALALHGRL